MTHLHADVVVDRPLGEAATVFDGPVAGWLPAIVGPDEASWRTETREGPVHVHVVVHAGDVWVLPDGAHRRTLQVQPDRGDFRDLLVAGLTPRIEGTLSLVGTDDPTRSRLEFDGATRRRSRMTSAVERVVVGDPLVRSGLGTLLHVVARRLVGASVDVASGPRHGAVRVRIPRGR